MKIYVSHSREFDYENELYSPLRDSSLNEKYDLFLPHAGKNKIKTKEVIKVSDLVIAEVSYTSTGQGIELGWADVMKVPIICFSKEGLKISDSLKYLTDNFVTYTKSENMPEKLDEIIMKSIK